MLTKEEKMQTLKNAIELISDPNTTSPPFVETIEQLEQWLSELNSEGWVSVDEKLPPIIKINDHSYGSLYYLVWCEYDGLTDAISARLEGSSEDKMFWYSPLLDDQIDNVTHWRTIQPPVK